jgi:predicted small secreted protein
MKKTVLALIVVSFMISSCATLFGGKISDCQRTKPKLGEASRKIRIVPLLLDGPWGLAIDFMTGAIYKPCDKKK